MEWAIEKDIARFLTGGVCDGPMAATCVDDHFYISYRLWVVSFALLALLRLGAGLDLLKGRMHLVGLFHGMYSH